MSSPERTRYHLKSTLANSLPVAEVKTLVRGIKARFDSQQQSHEVDSIMVPATETASPKEEEKILAELTKYQKEAQYRYWKTLSDVDKERSMKITDLTRKLLGVNDLVIFVKNNTNPESHQLNDTNPESLQFQFGDLLEKVELKDGRVLKGIVAYSTQAADMLIEVMTNENLKEFRFAAKLVPRHELSHIEYGDGTVASVIDLMADEGGREAAIKACAGFVAMTVYIEGGLVVWQVEATLAHLLGEPTDRSLKSELSGSVVNLGHQYLKKLQEEELRNPHLASLSSKEFFWRGT